MKNKVVVISGTGNVAQYTVEKTNDFWVKVMVLSDSFGGLYNESGITAEKLAYVIKLKFEDRVGLNEYIIKYSAARFTPNENPWKLP